MSTSSQENNDKSDEELGEYWTEERREQAIPKPFPIVEEEPVEGEPVDGGETQFTPPNTTVEPREESSDSAVLTPAVLATPVPTPAQWPWSANGKLFFDWKGNSYVGSAHSVYVNMLLTAGHNVYDQGEWSTNFLYYPAYPLWGKSWGWTRAAVFTAWQQGNYAYDYATILPSSLLTEVGSVGAVTSLSPAGRSWTAVGYPAAAPYPGNQMYETTGSYVSGSSIITMSNNDMTQGSSGGSWLTSYNGFLYVNGVQSHRTSNPTQAMSPYIATNDYNNVVQCALTGSCR